MSRLNKPQVVRLLIAVTAILLVALLATLAPLRDERADLSTSSLSATSEDAGASRRSRDGGSRSSDDRRIPAFDEWAIPSGFDVAPTGILRGDP